MVVFRVRGVPVKIGWSWFIVLALIFWSLASSLFPSAYPGLSGPAYLLMAGIATILFFASLLLHELSHTLRSQHEGVPVRSISLWLFGGVSEMDEPLPTPAAEFRVVIAGPLASAALAVVFFGIAAGGRALAVPDAVVGVADYLARINGLLLAFNLVPALPLDGGRLLHALLWWRSGDRSTATIHAAIAGRTFAALLAAAGVISLLIGSSLSGVWFLLLGWFVYDAVRREVVAARATQALDRLRVRDLMVSDLGTVGPATTIEEFARSLGPRPTQSAYPVVDGDRLVGLLVLRSAGAVPMDQRGTVRIAEVMLPADRVPVLHPDDAMADAARVVGREPGRAVVVQGPNAEIVGLLSASDLSRALQAGPARGRRWRRHRRETPTPGS